MSSSGSANGGARVAQGDASAGTDWKWQIGKALVIYMGSQAILGPNGLVSWYRGTSQLQNKEKQPQAMMSDSQISSGQTSQSYQGMSHQVPVSAKVSPQSTSNAFFPHMAPLDFYIFIESGGPATHEEMASQYSSLAPHGKGAWSAPPPDFSTDMYAELLKDPFKEALNGTKMVGGSPEIGVLPALKWSNVTLNDANLEKTAEITIKLPDQVKSENGSLWADIFAVPMGSPLGDRRAVRVRKMLTRLFPERKAREERHLFSRSDEEGSAEERSSSTTPSSKSSGLPFLDKEVPPLVTYWHDNLTLAIVAQEPGTGYPIGKLPPPVLQWVNVVETLEGDVVMGDGDVAANYPIVFPNDFWHLREHMYPINATLDAVPLHIKLYTTSFFKFQILAALGDSFEKQPSMASGELDIIKQTLLETSPWYLGLTFAVSILHSIFEFLAFSSDVSHWRNKENMTGVSLGSILTNVIVQLIILLYLLDQSQETSWMILGSQGIGIVIEAWKLTKAVTVSVVPRQRGEGWQTLSWIPYRIIVEDKHKLSEEEKKTQQYDRLAFKIVACVAAPLLGGYTIYSVLYETHKGWWSFIIGTLCSFVYAFGFVSLIPQLIVNYKLKSTAGMNPKTFVYKILGTVVDDFFAFAIRMPLLHRLACFRDDVVFLVFLYQRWVYGVDNTRANEFGQVVERIENKEFEEKDQVKKDQ